MREQYMRSGEGFILVYSITDRNSFRAASQYKTQIERVRRADDIPVVLVGNKYDLENKREVSTEEGQALARQFGCPFYETSAALRHFVDDVYINLVREIRKRERASLKNSDDQRSHRSRLRKLFSRLFKRHRAVVR